MSKNQIFDCIDNFLTGDLKISDDAKERLVSDFCRIKNQEITMPERREHYDFIVLRSHGRDGGISIKPGNIVLNWRELFKSLPTMILTGFGVSSQPYLVPLAGLVIWMDLFGKAKIELSAQHAITLQSMWNNHDGKQRIDDQKAHRCTNKLLQEMDFNELSFINFSRLIDDLSKIGCIELKDGNIWLREWIKRSFDD